MFFVSPGDFTALSRLSSTARLTAAGPFSHRPRDSLLLVLSPIDRATHCCWSFRSSTFFVGRLTVPSIADHRLNFVVLSSHLRQALQSLIGGASHTAKDSEFVTAFELLISAKTTSSSSALSTASITVLATSSASLHQSRPPDFPAH